VVGEGAAPRHANLAFPGAYNTRRTADATHRFTESYYHIRVDKCAVRTALPTLLYSCAGRRFFRRMSPKIENPVPSRNKAEGSGAATGDSLKS
jgi:hypothetical protein